MERDGLETLDRSPASQRVAKGRRLCLTWHNLCSWRRWILPRQRTRSGRRLMRNLHGWASSSLGLAPIPLLTNHKHPKFRKFRSLEWYGCCVKLLFGHFIAWSKSSVTKTCDIRLDPHFKSPSWKTNYGVLKVSRLMLMAVCLHLLREGSRPSENVLWRNQRISSISQLFLFNTLLLPSFLVRGVWLWANEPAYLQEIRLSG